MHRKTTLKKVCSTKRELEKRGCKKWYEKSMGAIYKDESIQWRERQENPSDLYW